MTVLLTPCHAGDLEHFLLLRESVERSGTQLEHVAVVHDEDLPLFRDRLPRAGVELVPSSAVLGASLDRRRRRGRHRWTRAVPGPLGGVGGWWTQQVVKLAVGERLGLDDWLCVDSDAVFLRPIGESDLRADDGRLHLQEHVGLGVGRSVRDFHRSSARLLGLGPTDVDADLSYVAWPVPVSGAVVRRLHAWLEAASGRSWVEAFLQGGATEYPLYGYFARYRDGLRDVVPVDKRWSRHVWDGDLAGIRTALGQSHADQQISVVMVHGGLGVDPASYRDVALGGLA